MCSIFNYAKWSRLEFGDVVIKDHRRWSCTVLWTLIKDTKKNHYHGWVVGCKGVKKKIGQADPDRKMGVAVGQPPWP